MTDVEFEALIASLRQQVADLTIERDRLKEESANVSMGLRSEIEFSSGVIIENNDMAEALSMLGVGVEEEKEVSENDMG